MKLRHKASGEIWEVEHFIARDAATGGKRVIDYLKGYELIPDDHPTPETATVNDAIMSNTRSIENLTLFGEDILKRVLSIESDSQRLKERLNAIEGLGIPR